MSVLKESELRQKWKEMVFPKGQPPLVDFVLGQTEQIVISDMQISKDELGLHYSTVLTKTLKDQDMQAIFEIEVYQVKRALAWLEIMYEDLNPRLRLVTDESNTAERLLDSLKILESQHFLEEIRKKALEKYNNPAA